MSFGADGFADGIAVGEEFLSQVGADEDNLGAVLVVGLGDEAPGSDVEIADLGEIGCGAHDHGVLHDGVAPACLDVAIFLGGNGLGEPHVVAKARVIVESDHGALLRFEELVAAGDDAEAVDEENIGSEIRDAFGDVHVQAGDHAHDEDEGGDGEDDAEEG